jgi:hypothetical protein
MPDRSPADDGTSVYISARLVTLPLSSLLPAPFGDASTKVRNFESFPIQEAACASERHDCRYRFACGTSFKLKAAGPLEVFFSEQDLRGQPALYRR